MSAEVGAALVALVILVLALASRWLGIGASQ